MTTTESTIFKPVDPRPDFPMLEEATLAWWRANDLMGTYVRKNAGATNPDGTPKRFSFIDGPITANNPMGVHHGWGRTYKDLFQRFKTMQGYEQRYQNGFDCQGLWVEVEVEKELGLNNKRDIETYGIDRFVETCKARVLTYAGVQTEQSIRLGYWMDWDNSYYTMSDENNYTIWLFLKRCFENGWVYKGHDVMPWCPRCGTGLTQAELADQYSDVVHASPFVALPLVDPQAPAQEGDALVVWTTTPWTLPANVAAAVNPDLTYARVRHEHPLYGEQIYWLAEGALKNLFPKGDYTLLDHAHGRDMAGWRYQGPFDELPAVQNALHGQHRVILWEKQGEQDKGVSADEGTGIVHIAPGCGKEDFDLSKRFDLPAIAPIDDAGIYVDGFGPFTGQYANDVARLVFAALRDRGVLARVQDYKHSYPHCWRCKTPIVFRLVDEWFISVEELRPRMMRVVDSIEWLPAFCRDREQDWLRNMGDWMISKKRYWGLALPIYECAACGTFEVIGGEEELKERAVAGWDEFAGHTPHRPWVDAVKIACKSCGETASRIKDVGNPWLDAGIVPFSTLHYRHDKDYWRAWFPARFITESFPGQFRNWFYSLLCMSTALEDTRPFEVCLGFATLLDERGKEMHKSTGNSIPFDEGAMEMSADAMRWLYTAHNPASNLRFGYKLAEETRRRFMIPLWNVYSFFVIYANIDHFDPTNESLPVASRAALDRWIISELQVTIAEVTRSLEEWDTARGNRALEAFVDNRSNWYVRRGRRRYWRGADATPEEDRDKTAAYLTLYETLTTLVRLLAPYTPFMAEELYQNLVRTVEPSAPESVHLTEWPVADLSLVERDLLEATRLTRHIVGVGLAARNTSKIKVRQPLARLRVTTRTAEEWQSVQPFVDQILDELNVKRLERLADDADVAAYTLRPVTPVLGPKLGKRLPAVIKALNGLDQQEAVATVRGGTPLRVTVGDETVELAPDEVQVMAAARPGYAVAEEDGYLAALDTEITPELADEGRAREFVHRVQTMRKSAGFDIADYILVTYAAAGSSRFAAALERNRDYVAGEILARELRAIATLDEVTGSYSESFDVEGEPVTVGIARANG